MIAVSCVLVVAPAVVMTPLPTPDGLVPDVVAEEPVPDVVAEEPVPDGDAAPPPAQNARQVETRWLGEETFDVEITRDGAHVIARTSDYGLLVVDPATGAVTARITPSDSVIDFAPAADGKSVFAVERDGIGRFDLGTGDLLAQFPVGKRLYDTAMAPDGRTVYASGNDEDRIFAIDTATGAVRASEPLGDAHLKVFVSADSQTLYAKRSSSSTEGTLVIDATSLAVVDNLALAYVTDIAVAPDGSRIYISFGDGIAVLDGRTQQEVGRFELPRAYGGPLRMVVSPDGAYLYAIVARDPSVRVIDAAAAQEVEAVPLEGEPDSLAIAPDGRRLNVSERNGDALWIVDTTAYTT
jgi:DNA-binding beta-propeller fold protein YncE